MAVPFLHGIGYNQSCSECRAAWAEIHSAIAKRRKPIIFCDSKDMFIIPCFLHLDKISEVAKSAYSV